MTQRIETQTITMAEYLANPSAASDHAERVGRIMVFDETGQRRMTISSNRASEAMLDRQKRITNGQVADLLDDEYAKGAKAATDRIMEWLRSHPATQAHQTRGTIADIIEDIEQGRHLK